ncbi:MULTISPECIES: hypothetical protein [unclassified Arthrobacter]|uniref:hypothetical protein n=1 Tax=unclassified Arthrobacter TaxID=235627 RepID=UPI002DFC6936|nr:MULTISPECIES: hypothetical protein [unclassified Arthrobacter]MEC5193302.1 hypothetical protein [Arthrobacter sp. MP_M4]MEC5204768.1 hypothetical protein [Arthrobacter sp. MP_M7]
MTQDRARWMECLDYLQPEIVLMVADLTTLGISVGATSKKARRTKTIVECALKAKATTGGA